MNDSTPQLGPSIIVIFGITGDLSQRYLLPALYHLFKDNLLNEHTEIVGLTRQDMTAEQLFERVELCINEVDNICDPAALKLIRSKTRLLRFDPSTPADYPMLHEKLDAIEDEQGVCMNRLYYLSIPPSLFNTVAENIGNSGLNGSCQHGTAATRVLVEKPFGADLASAEALISRTNEIFEEEQVFRIDHYLAKETVQNILVFRHANPIFADIWNANHIESIRILASEELGVANRAGFYDAVGALRDLVQNHLLQLLAITTMDVPADLQSEHIHAARQALLESIVPADPAKALRGQYSTYREEVKNPDSSTETYVRLTLAIDSERWHGVPLEIITGKMLSEKRTEIVVTFNSPDDKQANTLTFRIQPNEGIHLELRVKQPSFQAKLADAVMDFSYKQTFGTDSNHPDAYERVLVDAVKGDRTLFATSGEVLAAWRVIQPLIEAWQGNADGLITYEKGTKATDLPV